jgi:acetoin utilization protein AcuB
MPRPVPFLEVPVKHVMTPRPATVGPEDSLGDAAAVMVQGGFRHLPVVDASRRLVGMLSERDLRARLGTEVERFPDAAADLLADEVEGSMRPDPITISSRATLRNALEILEDERIGALPVVDGERLIGIVSYVDLLGYLRREAPPAAPARNVPRAAKPPRMAPARRKPAATRRGRRSGR